MSEGIAPPNFLAQLKQFLRKLGNKYKQLIQSSREKSGQFWKLFKDFYWAIGVATLLVLPIGLLLLFVKGYLLSEPMDTQIRADFSVNEFTFTLEDDTLVQSAQFKSITVSKFKQIRFNSSEWLDTGSHCTIVENLEIQPKEGGDIFYNATLTTDSENGAFGKLENFSINAGTIVTVKIHPDIPERLTVKLAQGNNESILSEPILLIFEQPFQLESMDNQIKPVITQQNNTKLEIELSKKAPYVNIEGQPNELEFSLVVANKQSFPLFAEDVVRIKDSKLFTEKRDEREVKKKSTLTKEGMINYVGFSEKKPVPFKESDLILVGTGSEFAIEKVIFDSKREEINLSLQGVATELKIISPLFPDEEVEDYRVTLYDEFEEGKLSKSILESVEWLILGIIAVAGIILIEKFKDLFKKGDKGKN